jgi:trimeric autotransporter adhesin
VVTEGNNAGTDTVQVFIDGDPLGTNTVSYTLAANIENLTYAGKGNFTGTGNNLSNIITGGNGDDTLDGGPGGNDTLIGGAGNDTYIIRNAGDVVTENANGGIDTVKTALGTHVLSANVENLTYTGAVGFTGTGNVLANVITGGVGNDTLSDGGVGGADTLIGGAGNDTYLVANTGDVITELAPGGTDTVRTTALSYTLGANVEDLTSVGAGNFTLTGNAQVNVITGGAGNDTLDGGKNTTGVDRLTGGAGNDTYIIRNAGDVITEAANGGTDTVQTTLNSYTLGNNLENLTFIGTGAFTGTGNGAANVITGGAGADTLTGGGGADTFILAKGDANGDRITDFTTAAGANHDSITFTGYGTTGVALVKTVTGTATTPTSYAVQVAGATVDTFQLTGNITLTATTDYKFV